MRCSDMMTRTKRKKRLIINTLLFIAAVFLLWALTGFDAVGKKSAFRRAMKEAVIFGVEPDTIIGTDGRLSAIGIKDGTAYQAVIQKDRWFFYENSSMVSETPKTGEVFIVELRAYGEFHDSPEIAVKAEGSRAELSIVMDEGGKEHPLICEGMQDGWFLFRYDEEEFDDRPSEGEFDLSDGEQAYEYLVTSPNGSIFGNPGEPYYQARLHGRFIFRSFNDDGTAACEEVRIF